MNSLRSVADSLCRSANDTGDNSTGVDPPYVTWNNKRTAKAAFDATAATLLAIQHFNTKNNSVVKDLSTLVSSCTVKLTVNVGDSQWDNDASVRQTIRTVAKHVNSEQSCPVPNGTVGPPPSPRNLQAPPSNQQVSSYFQDAFPCVLLGPTNEKAAKASDIFSSRIVCTFSIGSVPQVAGARSKRQHLMPHLYQNQDSSAAFFAAICFRSSVENCSTVPIAASMLSRIVASEIK